MSEILKALGLGIEIGDEASAQKLWTKWLNKFGYHPQQAFPDNISQGTNRVTFKGKQGDPITGRKSTIVNHLFNPTYKTYTYYDLDSGIPLMTRTRGITKGDLVAWAGIVSIKDVVGKRKPKNTNPLITTITRQLDGKPIIPEIFRLNEILERKGVSFKGKKPQMTKNPESPNEPWWIGLPIGADEHTKEEWLETRYPEYHKWLIENLHQPMEAKEKLKELGMTKDKVEFLKVIDELTPPTLLQTVIDDAVNKDNDKWHIVVLSNDTSHLKNLMLDAGFHQLTDELYAVLLNSKLSSFMQEALKAIGSKHGKLTGEKSSYYIRQTGGGDIMKAEWFNVLKIISAPDDDDDDVDLRSTITRIEPKIQNFDDQNVYESLEEVNVVDFCCDFIKEQIKKVIISTQEMIEAKYARRWGTSHSNDSDNVWKLDWWEDDLDNMDCTELNQLLDSAQADIVLEPNFNFSEEKHRLGGTIRRYLGLSTARKKEFPIFVDVEGRLHIDILAQWPELKEGATQGVKNTQPRTLAEVYEECLLTSRGWFEDPDSELSDDLRGKYSKKPGTPGERTLDEIGIDGRNIDRTRTWWEKTKNKKIDRWQPE